LCWIRAWSMATAKYMRPTKAMRTALVIYPTLPADAQSPGIQ
jgi:hypothetical protein